MDLKQEIRSFTPIDIEKFSQNNDVSEKIIDSVKAYNKAIEYLRTGSEDIAMIELKKVVSVNPDFYDAVNLLGLCYAYTNQMDKAEELFGKVVKGEDNVIRAADYLNYLNLGEDGSSRKKSRLKANKSPVQKVLKPEEVKREPVKKSGFSEEEVQAEYLLFRKIGSVMKRPEIALTFSILSIAFLIVAMIFFYLTIRQEKPADIDSEPTTGNSSVTVNADYEKALAQNKELQEQLDSANAKLKQVQLSSDISQASSLYSQKKYEAAADKLLSVPAGELGADLKKKYDSIKGDVLKKAANQLTTEGNSLYNSKKYPEAVKKLEKVFVYGSNWTFGDKTLYILAKSYVAADQKQKGAETYQKLIEQYPSSSYVSYAKSRLKSLQ